MPASVRGALITVEGGEGAGKSDLIRRLCADLTIDGHRVTATREPGASSIGPALRALLLDPSLPALDPRAEALLFAADRAQHVAETILPALERGDVVLCDRYADSSVAYQGIARGMGRREVDRLSRWATGGTTPDLTLLIDLDPAVGLARKHAQEQTNRMEDQEADFHQRVREGFLALAAAEPGRFVVLDGAASREQVHERAHRAIRDFLHERAASGGQVP